MDFTGAHHVLKMLMSFLFALLRTFVFMQILERIKLKDAIFIPLVGLVFGNIISSTSTFFAYKNDLIQNMTSWLQGDFSMIMTGNYELMFVTVPILAVAYLYANQFTIAGMGEDFSKNLVLNYRQIVNTGLAIVALVTASVVLSVGVIPFLGLIIPIIVPIYQGDPSKYTLNNLAYLD